MSTIEIRNATAQKGSVLPVEELLDINLLVRWFV
jgi:hypothetical protein